MKKLLFVMVLALGVVALMTPPAMAQDEKPFTIHGEARFRDDYNSNTTDFNTDSGDGGSFWPYRIRLAAEGHFAKNITAWIEFQNASVFGGDGSPVKNGHGEVDQGGNAQLYQGNITIDGLWGLKPGTASTGGTSTVLFSAGINAEADGLVGALTAAR